MFSTMSYPEISPQLRQIERSRVFQGLVITIIIMSALTVGVKTYELPPVFVVSLEWLDFGITIFFLCEITLRFYACTDKRRFFANPWNIFDTIIVLGSLIPLDQAETVLLGRLLRVFRVLRLISVVPELRFLINSLFKAIPRMGYIALLMFIIFYIYGAVGAIYFGSVNETLWGDISISMLTLFRVATFEDWTDVMYETMFVYPLSWLYFLSFIFLTAFVFLNMMVGAILEVMTSEKQQIEQGTQEQKVDKMAEELAMVNQKLDALLRKGH